MVDSPRTQRGNLWPWLWLAPLAALICTAASWLHFRLTGDIRLVEYPRSEALVRTGAMAAAGLVLLGVCCVAVYRRVGPSNLRQVLVCAIAVHVCMLLALPLYSTDLYTYLAYGEISAHGLNPHLVGPAALVDSPLPRLTTWSYTPSVYGPVADAAMALTGHIGQWTGSPLWAAGIAYKFLVGVLDISSLWLAYWLATRSKAPHLARGFAFLALNPLLAWEVAGQGHNDGFVVFGAVLYLAAVAKEREGVAIVSLALGTLAKFVLAPTLALHLRVVARTNLRRAVGLAFLALALAIVFYIPFWYGPEALMVWKPPHRADGSVHQALSLYTVLWKVLRVAHAPESLHVASFKAFVWCGRLIVAALGVTLFWRARTMEDVAHASLLLLVGAIATSAMLAPWYFTWLIPFAAVHKDARWQALSLAVTVAAAPSLGVSVLWLVLPAAQFACLVGLWRWRSNVPSEVEAARPDSAALG